MGRSIDISPDARRLILTFPYDKSLLDVVRGLPQRRFDPESKSWSVPARHFEQVVGRLHKHAFSLSEALLEHAEEVGHDLSIIQEQAKLRHRPLIDESLLPKGTRTVATLNHEVRDALRNAFRGEFWVAAEIQSFDRSSRRGGHAFFELVHRPFIGDDPVARVAAVIWAGDLEKIERSLHDDGGNVRLRDGLVVRLLCRADFYTGQGRYQVVASDIDLAYTTGTIHQRREVILRRLQEEGSLDLNRARAWPQAPLRLGLITSDGSDAYADFIDELERSGFGFQVYVYDAAMQGAHTESSMLEALGWFEARRDLFDALAIVRGGGARSDLAYFDTDAIGDAVCKHPLKIIVGVGHQRDVCLLDLIAHSEKTPTAAAQFFVARVRAFVERQTHLQEHILARADEVLSRASEELRARSEHAVRLLMERVDGEGRRVDRFAFSIASSARARLEVDGRRLDRVSTQIPASAAARVQISRASVEMAARRIAPERLERVLARAGERLERAQTRLERAPGRALGRAEAEIETRASKLRLLDPTRVLERGFAMVRDADGRLVRGSGDVEVGQTVSVRLGRGMLSADVTQASEEE